MMKRGEKCHMRIMYTNGNIFTMNLEEPLVQSIVIEDEEIIDLGTNEDMMLQWGRDNTTVIDLDGKYAFPGLIDSHLHISSVGINAQELDLTGIESKEKLLNVISNKARLIQPGEWILGRGWDENIFPDKQIPTIEELNYVSPDSPLFLPRVCGHAFLVNTKALEQSGYHDKLSVPYGGTVVTSTETNKPTGLLLETASTIITDRIPIKSYEQLKHAVKWGLEDALRVGLTGIHTNDPTYLNGAKQTYKLFNELINQEGIGPRSNLLMDYKYLEELKDAGMYAGYGNNKVMIGAIKFFADGALGGRTALLSEPYADSPGNYGNAMYEKEELLQLMRNCREFDMPIAVHTIGDQALIDVLDNLDKLKPVAYRDRLIHVSILNDQLIERLKSPNRIIDIQPRFVPSDYPWIVDRLGESRANLSYPFKTLLEKGVITAGSSDAPIEPLNPLLGIHAAVTRKKIGENHNGYNEAEKLSMYKAFKIFTVGGAYATNEENMKGTLERGKLGDMTVLNKNPFSMECADELLETEVEMTVIGGVIKYRK